MELKLLSIGSIDGCADAGDAGERAAPRGGAGRAPRRAPEHGRPPARTKHLRGVRTTHYVSRTNIARRGRKRLKSSWVSVITSVSKFVSQKESLRLRFEKNENDLVYKLNEHKNDIYAKRVKAVAVTKLVILVVIFIYAS